MDNLEPVREAIDEIAAIGVRVGRGALAGFIGGAIASWVMNQYQVIESKPVAVRREAELSAKTAHKPKQSSKKSAGDDATVKVAQNLSRKFFDHELQPNEKKLAGPVVHYGYGATVGALYGGLSEVLPTVGIGLGIPYATLLWLLGDEVAVPALGLSKPPTQTPAASHASALATHFVYGVALDISRRILRHLI